MVLEKRKWHITRSSFPSFHTPARLIRSLPTVASLMVSRNEWNERREGVRNPQGQSDYLPRFLRSLFTSPEPTVGRSLHSLSWSIARQSRSAALDGGHAKKGIERIENNDLIFLTCHAEDRISRTRSPMVPVIDRGKEVNGVDCNLSCFLLQFTFVLHGHSFNPHHSILLFSLSRERRERGWGWMRRKRLKGYCPVLHSLSLIQPPSHSPSRFSLFCRVT